MELAEKYAGYTDIDYLFYSRKNFKRPDLQVAPHRGFEEEVSLLDSFFDGGRAYCLGSINHDCWYLYTYNREGGGIAVQPQYDITDMVTIEPDQTIEILMTDLDPDVMALFTKEECKNAAEATKVSIAFDLNFMRVIAGMCVMTLMCDFSFWLQRSGIDKLIPDMIIDDYAFEPCGYSMNGVSKHGVSWMRKIEPFS